MKTPESRTKFMNELRANLDDVLVYGWVSRYWLAKRSLGEIGGKEQWIEYEEESAPQCVEFKSFAGVVIRLEFCEGSDCIEIYKNNEYQMRLEFDIYRNKVAYTAALVLYTERFAKA